MKHYLIKSLLLLAIIFTSCEKEMVSPNFSMSINPANVASVSKDTLVVYANKPVEFQLSGNPDNITFFSGENTHVYAFRNRISASGNPKLSFNYNSKGVTAAQKVDVLASTDFSGMNDSISIRTAKWDTITPTNMKTYLNTNAAIAISGIDLSKYATTPVYLAFRLVINSAARFIQPTFSALLIQNYQSADVYSPILNGFPAALMSFVTMSPNAAWKSNFGGVIGGNTAWKLNGSNIQISTQKFDILVTDQFGPTDGRIHEMWAVSTVIRLDATMPDTGVSTKNIFEPVSNYKYTYTKAGVYTVTFVASNTGNTGILGSTVKEVIVKVIDQPVL